MASDSPSEAPAVKAPLWTRSFVLIGLANLLVFTSFQMLLPTMPVYVARLGGQAAVMGIVIGIFTFSAVAIRPFVGWGLDSIGRKAVFLCGLVVLIISTLLYRWAPTIGWLLALRLVHGFGWGFSTTAAATIAADVIPRTRLGEGMSFFSLASTIAMAAGPALGLLIIERFSFPVLFYTGAVLAAAALPLSLAIRYSRHAAERDTKETIPAARQSALFETGALRPTLVMLLSNTTFGAIVTFVVLYGMQQGIPNMGLFFTLNAVALAVSRPVVGRLLDRRGYNIVVIPGLALVAAAMLLLWRAQSLIMFLMAAVVYGAGFGAIQPSMQALAVQGLPMNRRGAASATFYMGFDSGIGLGAIAWGFVSQWTGYANMYLIAGIPVVLALMVYQPIAHKRTLPPIHPEAS